MKWYISNSNLLIKMGVVLGEGPYGVHTMTCAPPSDSAHESHGHILAGHLALGPTPSRMAPTSLSSHYADKKINNNLI